MEPEKPLIDTRARGIGRLAWTGLLITTLLLLLAALLAGVKLRGALGKPLPVIGPVGDFTLTNQLGKQVSLADLRGRVWVADIIFTRCAGPCPRMTRQMKELQDGLAPSTSTQLISLTTDPVFDQPAVLKTYADRFGAKEERWLFLTGTPKQIEALAVNSLKLTAIENKPEQRQDPEDLFVHSTIFVVVDRQARLRGVFETTGEDIDAQRVKGQILAAVRRLEREP